MKNKSDLRNIGTENAAYTGNSNTTGKNDIVEFGADNINLSDEDIATDVLTTQKGLTKRYSTAITEVSCPNLRQLLQNKFSECADDQFDTFEYMNENGLYPTEDAPSQKVAKAAKDFSSKGDTAIENRGRNNG